MVASRLKRRIRFEYDSRFSLYKCIGWLNVGEIEVGQVYKKHDGDRLIRECREDGIEVEVKEAKL